MESNNKVVNEALSAEKNACVENAKFKVGDKAWVEPKYSWFTDVGYGPGVGIVKKDEGSSLVVAFKGHGDVRVPTPYCAKVGPGGKPVFNGCCVEMDSKNAVVNEALKACTKGS